MRLKKKAITTYIDTFRIHILHYNKNFIYYNEEEYYLNISYNRSNRINLGLITNITERSV